MPKIVIDTDKLPELIAKGDDIFLSPEGEEVLMSALALKEQIQQTIDDIKIKLEAKALAVNPNFKSIQSDKIKVFYRCFGSKYYIDQSYENQVPEEVVEKKIKLSLKTKELEQWIQSHGGLPLGVIENDRNKKITFSLKNAKESEEE